MVGSMRDPFVVATLVCRAHVEMALACLGTLQQHCCDPHTLLLFDDGSLSVEDTSRLEEHLGARVVSRVEAEDVVGPLVRSHPAARALRRDDYPPAIKLIDIPLYMAATSVSAPARRGAYGYTDTDIVFMRPFRGFDRRECGDTVVMSWNHVDAHSVTFYDRFVGTSRIRLPAHPNAGFMYVGAGVYDLDAVEAFLRQPAYRAPGTEWLVEQTAWGALAARAEGQYWNRQQIVIPVGDLEAHLNSAVALHFIHPVRATLSQALDTLTDLVHETSVRLGTIPLKFASPWRVVARRGMARLGTAAGRAWPDWRAASGPPN